MSTAVRFNGLWARLLTLLGGFELTLVLRHCEYRHGRGTPQRTVAPKCRRASDASSARKVILLTYSHPGGVGAGERGEQDYDTLEANHLKDGDGKAARCKPSISSL